MTIVSRETRFVGRRPVWVIRHGCTDLNREAGQGDRIRGWVDVPLNDQGRADAKKLAAALVGDGITLVYSSPLSRAFDTARDVADASGARIETSEGLRPWHMGMWAGQESNDIHELMREFIAQKPNEKIPDGESFNQFKHRTFDAVARILQADAKETLAIVTHHRVERLLAAWAAAGQDADRTLDYDVMLTHGEGTATAQLMRLDGAAMAGATSPDKVDKPSVDYSRAGVGQDRCGECAYFHPGFWPPYFTPLCRRVKGSIDKDAWCQLYEPVQQPHLTRAVALVE